VPRIPDIDFIKVIVFLFVSDDKYRKLLSN
jgi:hypothetical protein